MKTANRYSRIAEKGDSRKLSFRFEAFSETRGFRFMEFSEVEQASCSLSDAPTPPNPYPVLRN